MAFNSPKRSMFEQGQVHEQNTLFASPKQCATREGDTVTSRWRSWLRHCATNRRVAGSINDGVIGFFSLT